MAWIFVMFKDRGFKMFSLLLGSSYSTLCPRSKPLDVVSDLCYDKLLLIEDSAGLILPMTVQ